MKQFFKAIVEEIFYSKMIKFSQQETLTSGNVRTVGFVDLISAPEKGTFLLVEHKDKEGRKYFKSYEVENTTILVFEDGHKEGFIYLRFKGVQHF